MRSSHRHPALAFLFLASSLLAACGGGGGGPGSANQDPPEPPDPAAFVQQAVTDCLASDALALLELLADLQATLEGNPDGTQPAITLDSVDLAQNSAAVSVDLDLDGSTDLTASLRLANAAGQPALSALDFAALVLNASGQDLTSLLTGLPDGTRVIVTFQTLTAPSGSGQLDLTVEGGVIVRGSGTVIVTGLECTTTFTFQDVPAAALLNGGLYPELEAAWSIDTPGGEISGLLVLDGTNLAGVSATYLGVPYAYTLDLDTGAVTPVP